MAVVDIKEGMTTDQLLMDRDVVIQNFANSFENKTIENAFALGTFSLSSSESIIKDFTSPYRTPDAPSLNRLFFEMPLFRDVITTQPRNYVQEYFRGLSRLDSILKFEGKASPTHLSDFVKFGSMYGGEGVKESIQLGSNISDYQKEANRTRFQNDLTLGGLSFIAAVSVFLSVGGASWLGATQSAESASTAAASSSASSTTGASIDPAFFGYDTPLFGASEFSFEPIVLTSNQSALVSGAPAVSLFETSPSWVDSKFLQFTNIINTSQLSKTFVDLFGKTGQAILQFISGDFKGAIQTLTANNSIAGSNNSTLTTSRQRDSGGGGAGFSPSQVQSSINFLPFLVIGSIIVVIVLLLRRK